MKTLIVYMTKHGCTEKCAEKIKDGLDSSVDLMNLKKQKPENLKPYDRIIVGGSIHASQVQKKVSDFCENHKEELLGKKLGLYLCCMEEGEKAQQQFEEAFPQELIDHAAAAEILGGEFNFERMNIFEKAVVRKIANVGKSVSKISDEKIREFVQKMNA